MVSLMSFILSVILTVLEAFSNTRNYAKSRGHIGTRTWSLSSDREELWEHNNYSYNLLCIFCAKYSAENSTCIPLFDHCSNSMRGQYYYNHAL